MAHATGPAPRTSRVAPPVQPASGRSFAGFLRAIRAAASPWVSMARPGSPVAGSKALDTLYGSPYVSQPHATVTKSAMGEEVGQLGGYIVPTDFTMKLLEVIAEESFIYPRANVIPMASAEMLAPRIDVETSTGVSGLTPVFGGLAFTWGSSQPPTETEPQFRQLHLKAWDLLGYAVVDNQFLEDTGNDNSGYLLDLFGKAAAWYMEYAFLQGTGVDSQMPLGILNCPALISVARHTTNKVDATDIGNLAAAMLPFGWKRSIWACSPSVLAQLVQISGFLLNQTSNQLELERDGGSGAIMSRPMFVTDKLPPLGTKGDLVFFDPWLYAIGERQEVIIDVSDQALFRSRQTVFRIWLRVDGKPQVSSSITLQDTSTVVSPYIALAR